MRWVGILGTEMTVKLQVAKLSARLKEREEQLSEAQDCYSKLDALYQAEKADNSAALSSKVCPGALHAVK